MKYLHQLLKQCAVFIALLGIVLFLQTTVSAAETLTVNPDVAVHPFSKDMRGVGLANWEHAWNKPFINDVQGLDVAFKEINPGILRYAGGNWTNWVGFDRSPYRAPYANPEWSPNKYSNPKATYSFTYGTNEIDSLGLFAKKIGADVMIEVNVLTSDPLMWADMVRYANVEKHYNFKYWELGNENDVDFQHALMDTNTYMSRLKEYEAAMKAVDSSIIVFGSAGAAAVDENTSLGQRNQSINNMIKLLPQTHASNGYPVQAVSYHWYQQCWLSSMDKISEYMFTDFTAKDAVQRYSRSWGSTLPARIRSEILGNSQVPKIGVTELNVDACDYRGQENYNHLAAVWFGDILGRQAYSGTDFVTMYLGYSEDQYGLIAHTTFDSPPASFSLNPTYYTYYMYSKFFGDTMVQSSTTNNFLPVWASTKTGVPNKVYLMVSNFNYAASPASITIGNKQISDVKVYSLEPSKQITSSTNPNSTITSKINGVSLNYNTIATALSTIPARTASYSGGTITYSFPPWTLTAIEVTIGGTISQVPLPTAVPTVLPTARPTVPTAPSPTRVVSTTAPTNTLTVTRTTTIANSQVPTPVCPMRSQGDTSCDGTVSLSDFELIRRNFGTVNAQIDVNGDGTITMADFTVWLGTFLKR